MWTFIEGFVIHNTVFTRSNIDLIFLLYLIALEDPEALLKLTDTLSMARLMYRPFMSPLSFSSDFRADSSDAK